MIKASDRYFYLYLLNVGVKVNNYRKSYSHLHYQDFLPFMQVILPDVSLHFSGIYLEAKRLL